MLYVFICGWWLLLIDLTACLEDAGAREERGHGASGRAVGIDGRAECRVVARARDLERTDGGSCIINEEPSE